MLGEAYLCSQYAAIICLMKVFVAFVYKNVEL